MIAVGRNRFSYTSLLNVAERADRIENAASACLVKPRATSHDSPFSSFNITRVCEMFLIYVYYCPCFTHSFFIPVVLQVLTAES